jgi:2'-5' RNA ligase
MFLALPLPEAVRAVLATVMEPLPGIVWTRPKQLHVTLRFLGDVPEEQIPVMTTRLTEVKVEPFILPLEGCGTFPPNAPPRVLWIGVGSGHPRLFQLRQRLDDALLACGLRFEVRTFHPHVTLARCKDESGPVVAKWLQTQREFAAPPFRVDSFDLYASALRPTGAVHALRGRFPLEK